MTNPEVDAYIAAAPAYAQPILQRVRSAFQRVCPEVTESIKWRHPSFGFRGKILAGIGAWKNHVRFGFWEAADLPDPHGFFSGAQAGAKHLRAVADLPDDAVLDACIAEAIRQQESGAKRRRPAVRVPKPGLVPPPEFIEALRQQPAAEKAFEALVPSHRREYLEWILAAKQETTRWRRIQTALGWLAEGKSLNWKYEREGRAAASKKEGGAGSPSRP